MPTPIHRFQKGLLQPVSDELTPEEPLQIRLRQAGKTRELAITMRTPGEDAALALGFLYSEGILSDPSEEVVEITTGGQGPREKNTVTVSLREGVKIDWEGLSRHSYVSSSCGVCGKAALEQVYQALPAEPLRKAMKVSALVIPTLADRLREGQRWFARTGGIHAAGLFTGEGEMVRLTEDVGRHNALDKLVGMEWLNGGGDEVIDSPALEDRSTGGDSPLASFGRALEYRRTWRCSPPTPSAFADKVLVLSGRASFELIQKAAMAGIAFVVAVGAPSTLAVELARDQEMTLCGFATKGRFNCYAGVERIGIE